MESISGSGDISNLCDNCLIIHRVGRDFISRGGQFLGEDKVNDFANYDAVIEVCKNRAMGVKDFLVGLYYEKESRRLKSDIAEHINYGWIDADEDFVMNKRIEQIQPNENFYTTTNSIYDTIENFDNNYGLPY